MKKLEFNRNNKLEITFFLENDGYLEIGDSDSCLIILDPNEVKELINFLENKTNHD